jgi:hypothetical protein
VEPAHVEERHGLRVRVVRGGGTGAAAADAIGTDGGAVGTTPSRARRGKWPMGRLSGWVWAGTVELG